MSLTKQDIDALVDGMVPSRVWPGAVKLDSKPGGWIKDADELKRQLYVSAGLSAEGARKPERVKCWMARGDLGPIFIPDHEGKPAWDWEHECPSTPGWFVPDSDRNLKDGAE